MLEALYWYFRVFSVNTCWMDNALYVNAGNAVPCFILIAVKIVHQHNRIDSHDIVVGTGIGLLYPDQVLLSRIFYKAQKIMTLHENNGVCGAVLLPCICRSQAVGSVLVPDRVGYFSLDGSHC